MALDVDAEISDVSLYADNFAVRKNADVRILAYFRHFRRNDTRSAVEGRECLVEHSHFSADRRLFFNDVNRESCVCNVKRSSNSGDTASDDKRALCNRRFARCKRRVEYCFCNGSFSKRDCLFSRLFHILKNPGGLLADICDFYFIWIQPRTFCARTECLFVHTRRAGTKDNACKLVVLDMILNHFLTGRGTHIGVVR